MSRSANPDTIACPICQSPGHDKLLGLTMRERKFLPTDVSIYLCDRCDFAFVAPADEIEYGKYYAIEQNDNVGAFDGQSALDVERYRGQSEAISPFLKADRPLNVLDIGCGRAGLLQTLKLAFPRHHFFGSDPNISQDLIDACPNIKLNRDWSSYAMKFDLIICSHTLEHIIDLTDVMRIANLLNEDGTLYVEVPDASRYHSFPRREYLYYFDRLHVNHFSLQSLEAILSRAGLEIISYGFADFEYKDNKPYPAIYALGSASSGERIRPSGGSLRNSLKEYLSSERDKLFARMAEVPRDPYLVYGFGDNFFRHFGPGGPLHHAEILAVVDRDWEALSRSHYAHTYTFMSPDKAASEFPNDKTHLYRLAYVD